MRVSKKNNAVDAKKTRSCVVRLEKVRSTPVKINKGIAVLKNAVKMTQPQEEIMTKGPLKKRPVSEESSLMQKEKEKLTHKNAKQSMLSESISETPLTIAAGRSRRSIKPNPKYASEDMVTPKLMKNVGHFAASAHKKPNNEKPRKHSSSSSEDFFNKDSSDELGDELDKAFTVTMKDIDSDFSEVEEPLPLRIPRRRGRPRKDEKALWDSLRAGLVTPSSKGLKATQSQLQQLRKTFAAANSNRSVELTPGRKRKFDLGDDGESSITRKRFVLSPLGITYKSPGRDDKLLQVNHRNLSLKSSQTLNGSKIISSQLSDDEDVVTMPEKRKSLTDKTLAKFITKPSSTSASQFMLNKSLSAKLKVSSSSRRSSSPALQKGAKGSEGTEENKTTDAATGATDDPDAMPTFTIVNINDIINKKGDVLISKTIAKNMKKLNPDDSMSLTSPALETKLGRRKTVHTTILSEKADLDRSKNPTRMPYSTKKPHTILNHTLLNKASANGKRSVRGSRGSLNDSPTSPEKPIPRILNSMVAKKTLPVKPMIANPDDSADESFALSLEDEEDVEEDADGGTFGRKRTPSSSPHTTPASKENSIISSKRFFTKQMQRKFSPEKVIISRQGDKIIKKITCFETWYVIKVADDSQVKVDRNILDMPITKLANISKEINLPSECWSSKVTLFETPTMPKTSFITYTGDLTEHKIGEEDRSKYQPSCVMFRRAVTDRLKSRLPYDRAVIFKNKTFFINIEGKNVRLLGAPTSLCNKDEVETILELVDTLTLQSPFVEATSTVQ